MEGARLATLLLLVLPLASSVDWPNFGPGNYWRGNPYPYNPNAPQNQCPWDEDREYDSFPLLDRQSAGGGAKFVQASPERDISCGWTTYYIVPIPEGTDRFRMDMGRNLLADQQRDMDANVTVYFGYGYKPYENSWDVKMNAVAGVDFRTHAEGTPAPDTFNVSVRFPRSGNLWIGVELDRRPDGSCTSDVYPMVFAFLVQSCSLQSPPSDGTQGYEITDGSVFGAKFINPNCDPSFTAKWLNNENSALEQLSAGAFDADKMPGLYSLPMPWKPLHVGRTFVPTDGELAAWLRIVVLSRDVPISPNKVYVRYAGIPIENPDYLFLDDYFDMTNATMNYTGLQYEYYIPVPVAGYYYAGIYSDGANRVYAHATLEMCPPMTGGVLCDKPLTEVTPGELLSVSGPLAAYVDVPCGSGSVDLQIDVGTGGSPVAIYIRRFNLPNSINNTEFMFNASYSHTISLPSPLPGRYYISSLEEVGDFDVIANVNWMCPNNCNGHGVCDLMSQECHCDCERDGGGVCRTSYMGSDCSERRCQDYHQCDECVEDAACAWCDDSQTCVLGGTGSQAFLSGMCTVGFSGTCPGLPVFEDAPSATAPEAWVPPPRVMSLATRCGRRVYFMGGVEPEYFNIDFLGGDDEGEGEEEQEQGGDNLWGQRGQNFCDFVYYDLDSQTWGNVTSAAPKCRFNAKLFCYEGDLIVAGGYSEDVVPENMTRGKQTDIHRLNLASGVWTELFPDCPDNTTDPLCVMPSYYIPTVAFDPDNYRMFFFGGRDLFTEFVDCNLYSIDLSSRGTTNHGCVFGDIGHLFPTLTYLPDTLILASGLDTGTQYQTSWVYRLNLVTMDVDYLPQGYTGKSVSFSDSVVDLGDGRRVLFIGGISTGHLKNNGEFSWTTLPCRIRDDTSYVDNCPVSATPGRDLVMSKPMIFDVSNGASYGLTASTDHSTVAIGATVVEADGDVLIFFGMTRQNDGQVPREHVSRIKLTRNTITSPAGDVASQPDAPSARWMHTAVRHEDTMLVFGGTADYTVLDDPTTGAPLDNDVYRFDLATETWSKVACAGGDCPTAVFGHTAVMSGTSMVVFGGWTGAVLTDQLMAFNAVTSTWSTITATGTPPPRSFHCASAFEGVIRFFGGAELSGGTMGPSPRLFTYDVAASTFTEEAACCTTADRAPLAMSIYQRCAHDAKGDLLVWGSSYYASGQGFVPVGGMTGGNNNLLVFNTGGGGSWFTEKGPAVMGQAAADVNGITVALGGIAAGADGGAHPVRAVYQFVPGINLGTSNLNARRALRVGAVAQTLTAFSSAIYDPTRKRMVLFGGGLTHVGFDYMGDFVAYFNENVTISASAPVSIQSQGGVDVELSGANFPVIEDRYDYDMFHYEVRCDMDAFADSTPGVPASATGELAYHAQAFVRSSDTAECLAVPPHATGPAVPARMLVVQQTGPFSSTFPRAKDFVMAPRLVAVVTPTVDIAYEGCPTGMQSALYHEPCQPCPAGTANNAVGGMCTPCPEVEYQNATGQAECLVCGAGFVRRSAVLCERCKPGQYTDADGSTECLICPTGTYNPTFGAAQCLACPEFTVTAPSGDNFPDSEDDCLCQVGYWRNPESGNCELCPEGAECPRVETVLPEPLAGYWRDPLDPSRIMRCQPPEACLGGALSECGIGFTDAETEACAACAPNFYRINNTCEACPKNGKLPMIIAGIIALILLIILLRYASKYRGGGKGGTFGSVGIAVGFIQVTAVLGRMGVNWPPEMLMVFSWYSILNFNVDVASPECAVPIKYSEKWAFLMLFPVAVMVLMLLQFGLICLRTLFLRKCLSQERQDSHWLLKPSTNEELLESRDGFFHVLLMMGSTGYIFLVSRALEPFSCERQLDGTHFVIAYPPLKCYTDPEWKGLVGPAIVCMVVYGLMMPAYFAYLLFFSLKKHNAKGTPEVFARKFGFLTSQYTMRWYFWELLIIGRKLLIVLITLFITDFVIFQTLLIILILFASLLVQVYARPYFFLKDDRLESVLLTTEFLIVFVGLIFYSEKIGEGTSAYGFLKFLGMTMLIGSLAAIWIYLLVEVRSAMVTARYRKIRSRAECAAILESCEPLLKEKGQVRLMKWLRNATDEDVERLQKISDQLEHEYMHQTFERNTFYASVLRKETRAVIVEWQQSAQADDQEFLEGLLRDLDQKHIAQRRSSVAPLLNGSAQTEDFDTVCENPVGLKGATDTSSSGGTTEEEGGGGGGEAAPHAQPPATSTATGSTQGAPGASGATSPREDAALGQERSIAETALAQRAVQGKSKQSLVSADTRRTSFATTRDVDLDDNSSTGSESN